MGDGFQKEYDVFCLVGGGWIEKSVGSRGGEVCDEFIKVVFLFFCGQSFCDFEL